MKIGVIGEKKDDNQFKLNELIKGVVKNNKQHRILAKECDHKFKLLRLSWRLNGDHDEQPIPNKKYKKLKQSENSPIGHQHHGPKNT